MTRADLTGQKIILPLSPIPPIPYLVALARKGDVIFDAGEHFIKQTIRNRYHILTANGVLALSLNVAGQKGTKITTGEIEIDYRKNWVRDHLRAIESAYRSAPFFEHFYPEVEAILSEKYPNVSAFFDASFSRYLKLVGIESRYTISQDYLDASDFLDLRKRIKHPEQFPTQLASEQYLQVFSDRFAFKPNLSVIDLLMNAGPASSSYLA